MQKVVLYPHGGSGNHGCEALVRATCKIIKNANAILATRSKNEDSTYALDEICTLINEQEQISKCSFSYIKAAIKYHLFKDQDAFEAITYKSITNSVKNNGIALSIGGDNYCYGVPTYIYIINRLLRKQGTLTILWGCSIEPSSINNEMLDDLKSYSLIIARESITYEAMVKAGLKNVKLLPDPAFQLDQVDLELPDGFVEGNTVGINLSPMVMGCENGKNITFKNYEKLIEGIIADTDMQIALIPHVVWCENDDRVPLRMLFEKYKHTGRVVMIEDHNCMELKGYIARCRFMIAARTHASIAAYSTCVPTLVVGYSVKAKGIAKDIFGTYENYVLPVQSLAQEDDLKNAFDWIYKNEDLIRTHLQSMMPEYRERALLIGEELKKIM